MPHFSNTPLFNFSVSLSQVTIYAFISTSCYNESGQTVNTQASLNLTGFPFAISASRNKFTTTGCNTAASIEQANGSFIRGCMSFCDDLDISADNSCGGVGCCQTSLPKNLLDYDSYIFNRDPNDTTWKFNPCSYSFMADQEGWFKFDVS